MPYVTLQTNLKLDDAQQQTLLSSLTHQIAAILKKPEAYMMVSLQTAAVMNFAGSNAPTAFISIQSIGFASGSIPNLSKELTALLETQLNIAADRIFIQFCDVTADKWAWNGNTFA